MKNRDGIPIVTARRFWRTCWQCRKPYVSHVQTGVDVPVRGLCGVCLRLETVAELSDACALLTVYDRLAVAS